MSSVVRPIGDVVGGEVLGLRMARSFDEIADMREEWDALVEAVDGDVYMTFDWCRTWWEHYGDGRSLFVFLFDAGGKLCGVLPVFVERVWLGPVWLRIAKFVGSDHTMTLCDPPVVPRLAPEVFDELVKWMVKNERVDAVMFGPLSGTKWEGLNWDRVGDACAAPVKREAQHACHTVFHLPRSMEQYWKLFKAQDRGNLKRRIRLLEKQGPVTVTSATDPSACMKMFEDFREMHERQWHDEGKLGHFRDWPRALDFNRALVQRLSRLNRVLLTEVRVGDEPVAYHYCYRFGKREFWRLPARLVGEEWNRIGLGMVALIKKIEVAIYNGTSYVEDGFGHYDYKLFAKGTEYPTRQMLYVANRSFVQLRLGLFTRLSKLFHFVYYRMWFLKAAPKLPLPRKPLLRRWIRSRL